MATKAVVGLVFLVISIIGVVYFTHKAWVDHVEEEQANLELEKAKVETKEAREELDELIASAPGNHEGIAKAYSVYQKEFKEKYPETAPEPESWQEIMNRMWPGELGSQ